MILLQKRTFKQLFFLNLVSLVFNWGLLTLNPGKRLHVNFSVRVLSTVICTGCKLHPAHPKAFLKAKCTTLIFFLPLGIQQSTDTQLMKSNWVSNGLSLSRFREMLKMTTLRSQKGKIGVFPLLLHLQFHCFTPFPTAHNLQTSNAWRQFHVPVVPGKASLLSSFAGSSPLSLQCVLLLTAFSL